MVAADEQDLVAYSSKLPSLPGDQQQEELQKRISNIIDQSAESSS
jgi:hypothetical protein